MHPGGACRLFRQGGRWCGRGFSRKAENAIAGRWRRCGHDGGSVSALVPGVAVGALASGVPAFAASPDVGTAPRIPRAAAARCEGQSLAATLAWVGRSDGVGGRPVPPDVHGGFRARRVLCWAWGLRVRTKMGPHRSDPFLAEVEKNWRRVRKNSSNATGFGLWPHNNQQDRPNGESRGDARRRWCRGCTMPEI